MKTNTQTVLKITNILSWIIFIGLCIQTGAISFSYLVSIFMNPIGSENINLGLNLSELYKNSIPYYSILILLMVLISGLKAYIFYFIIKIFMKINLVNPFSKEIYSLIIKISAVALTIGILAIIGEKYCEWLLSENLHLPMLNLEQYIGGKSEFLFMAAIIFVIAQIFKRGIEIQAENELTI